MLKFFFNLEYSAFEEVTNFIHFYDFIKTFELKENNFMNNLFESVKMNGNLNKINNM